MRTFSSCYLIFDAISSAIVDKITYIKQKTRPKQRQKKLHTRWKAFYPCMMKSVH
jgi:hypothetical protein